MPRIIRALTSDAFLSAWLLIAGLLMLVFIAYPALKRVEDAQREAAVLNWRMG